MVKENKMVQTEIGLLPEDWEVVNLGEVVKIFSGNSFKSSDAQELGIRWLKIANVGLNRVEWNDESFLPKSFYNIYKDYVLNKGDIVIALTRPLLGLKLKIAEIKDNDSPSLLNQRVGKIETDLNKKFVYYLFQSNIFLQKLNDSMLGTDPPNMSVNIVYKFQIPLPPLPEQEAIASVLSDTDVWIEGLEKLIAKKRLIKQGAMQELLAPKEDWKMKKLGDVGEVRMCKRVFQHQTSEIGEIPFFKIGTFGKQPDAFITREHFEDFKLRFSYPKEGEILISAAGTIGRTVVYDGAENYYQDSNIVWLENDEKLVLNTFLKYLLDVIKYNTEGGTIQRLYNSILKSTVFDCPSLTEQSRIANILSDMDAELEALATQLEKAKKIKQGMMQELLTGRIRLV